MSAMASQITHRHVDGLLNCLFRRRSKKTPKLRVTGLCEGISPIIGEFPSQRASNSENISIWWRHHGEFLLAPSTLRPCNTSIRYGLSCSKLLPVRLPEADNFGGGPGTFLIIFFNFIFMIWDSRQEDWQLFWLSFEHKLSSPMRHQVITWSNFDALSIGPLI